MFGNRKHRKNSRSASKPTARIRQVVNELLEKRTMMSATTSDTGFFNMAKPATQAPPESVFTAFNAGYIPSQIRSAYGWNTATFSSIGSTVAADGAGQTIAIIDATDDTGIRSDLATFDAAYGIPDLAFYNGPGGTQTSPSLEVVGQDGSPNDLPTTSDADDVGETSLDVEWAHAMAPAANILLIEADDLTLQNIVPAMQTASGAIGVSVISMSFGFPEGELGALETDLDSVFTTPAGHQGVTFIASAGDSGPTALASWPADSPNVVAVGGTALTINNSNGVYAGESAWSDSQSALSTVEPEPPYQEIAQQSGTRNVADVAYNAAPGTGVAVFDSTPGEDGSVGWAPIGGTSAGAPQWAALLAIANQGRALQGLGTLDGATQTLPKLYSVYSGPFTSGYSNYASYFNDVTTGGDIGYGYVNFGVGSTVFDATVGYDPITGLGTPKVPAIVDLLDAPPPVLPTGTAGNGAAAGSVVFSGNAALAPSPFFARLTTPLPSGVIAGQAGTMRLSLTDSSSTAFRSPVTVSLDATTNGTTDQLIQTYSFPLISLKSGRSVSELLKFSYPSSLDGTYYLVAFVSTSEAETGVASAVTSNSAFIGPATVDLATAFANNTAVKITPGASNSAYITITNTGNVTAAGTLSLALYASADSVLDSSDTLLTSISNKAIRLAPRKSIRIRVVFQSPDNLLGGAFDLISSISSTTTPSDTNSSNNTAYVGTTAS